MSLNMCSSIRVISDKPSSKRFQAALGSKAALQKVRAKKPIAAVVLMYIDIPQSDAVTFLRHDFFNE